MSTMTAVLELFRGRPRNPVGEGGRMALADHFRELRARVMRCALYIIVGTVVAFFFWHQLFDFIYHPYAKALTLLHRDVKTKVYVEGVGGGLMLQFKLCGFAGVVCTSPLWLYEIWSFIVPGLHANERRWTTLFIAVAGPLFFAGVAVAYWVLPKGIAVLIGFTPHQLLNLNNFEDFFGFITRMLLIFGLSFEIPLFVVLLNLAGVVKGKALARYRPWIILGTFIFAAVATPSTDPISMTVLAVPMCVLFLLSEVIARTVDRRRAEAKNAVQVYDDDQASPL